MKIQIIKLEINFHELLVNEVMPLNNTDTLINESNIT